MEYVLTSRTLAAIYFGGILFLWVIAPIFMALYRVIWKHRFSHERSLRAFGVEYGEATGETFFRAPLWPLMLVVMAVCILYEIWRSLCEAVRWVHTQLPKMRAKK